MLFRADNNNLKIVFMPARSETTSDALNFSQRVLPSFLVPKEKVSLLLLITSGSNEEAKAEINFFFPENSISSDADLTLGVKQFQSERRDYFPIL